MSLSIEVAPTANATVKMLQRQALRQLADLLDVDSPEEAIRLVTNVDFDVYTDGFIRIAEGDLISTYPILRATMTAQLVDFERGTYSGRLF